MGRPFRLASLEDLRTGETIASTRCWDMVSCVKPSVRLFIAPLSRELISEKRSTGVLHSCVPGIAIRALGRGLLKKLRMVWH